MQNILTQTLEIVVIYQLVAFALSCAFYVKNRLTQTENAVAEHFDNGVKAVMTIEPEVKAQPIITKSTSKIRPSVQSVPPVETLTIASMRAYIKADKLRKARIDAFLTQHNCDRRRKADLARAIRAVG